MIDVDEALGRVATADKVKVERVADVLVVQGRGAGEDLPRGSGVRGLGANIAPASPERAAAGHAVLDGPVHGGSDDAVGAHGQRLLQAVVGVRVRARQPVAEAVEGGTVGHNGAGARRGASRYLGELRKVDGRPAVLPELEVGVDRLLGRSASGTSGDGDGAGGQRDGASRQSNGTGGESVGLDLRRGRECKRIGIDLGLRHGEQRDGGTRQRDGAGSECVRLDAGLHSDGDGAGYRDGDGAARSRRRGGGGEAG